MCLFVTQYMWAILFMFLHVLFMLGSGIVFSYLVSSVDGHTSESGDVLSTHGPVMILLYLLVLCCVLESLEF